MGVGLAGPRHEDKADLGCFIAPKEGVEFSPGFQPWESTYRIYVRSGARLGRNRPRTRPRNLSWPPQAGIFAGDKSNKLALMGLKPWAKFSYPFGAKDSSERSLSSSRACGASKLADRESMILTKWEWWTTSRAS